MIIKNNDNGDISVGHGHLFNRISDRAKMKGGSDKKGRKKG